MSVYFLGEHFYFILFYFSNRERDKDIFLPNLNISMWRDGQVGEGRGMLNDRHRPDRTGKDSEDSPTTTSHIDDDVC